MDRDPLPDMVYYNLDIINGKVVDEGYNLAPTARFNETRDTAIIKDTSKYVFSIVRFSMDGSDKTLPMFIPRIQLNQADINKTVYQIGFKVNVEYDFGSGNVSNTFFAEKFISFEPQNENADIPSGPVGETKDFIVPYYLVYNYDWVVYLVNKTYQELFTDLNTQFSAFAVANGANPTNLTTTVPYMKYNPDTGRFILYNDTYGFGENTSAGTSASEEITMFFNSNMYGLFSNFPHTYLGGDDANNNTLQRDGYAYEIYVRNDNGSNIFRPDNPLNTSISNTPSYWIAEQDYKSTSSLWSPISSIVFVSTLMPIVNEQTGQPIRYGAGNSTISQGTQSAFQPIITDIALPLENANGYNEFLSYVPTAEYRLSSFSSSPQEIRNIDIQVYWKSRLDGNLYPVELFNLSNISVKILFRKKY